MNTTRIFQKSQWLVDRLSGDDGGTAWQVVEIVEKE
jgi:hypothetical protein